MTQDPNAWWSKEIGKDFHKGIVQPVKDLYVSFKLMSSRERRKFIVRMILGLAWTAIIYYVLFKLLWHTAR